MPGRHTKIKFVLYSCWEDITHRLADQNLQSTLEVTEADYDRCFDVNVKSIFYSTSAIIPYFLKQKKGGCIINVASVGATRPRPGLVWYNASKGAVCNVSLSLLVTTAARLTWMCTRQRKALQLSLARMGFE